MSDPRPSDPASGPPPRRRLPVVLAIGIGIAFSLAAAWAIHWWESQAIARAFLLAADERTTAVKGAFQIEVAMLELLRASLMTDGRVERKEFHEILAPFHAHDASIEAVEWLPRVLDGQREQFEAAARRDGFEGFQITETDKSGHIVRAPRRDEYFPILYVGPRTYDKSILGYDVGSEPIRLECLRLACNSGQAVASGRFTFIQDPTKSGGFLVCLPVYEKDRPWNTLADRRKNLLGFVLGVFRPSDMLDAALAKLQPQGVDVGLYDPSVAHTGQAIDFHVSRMRDDSANPIDIHELIRFPIQSCAPSIALSYITRYDSGILKGCCYGSSRSCDIGDVAMAGEQGDQCPTCKAIANYHSSHSRLYRFQHLVDA